MSSRPEARSRSLRRRELNGPEANGVGEGSTRKGVLGFVLVDVAVDKSTSVGAREDERYRLRWWAWVVEVGSEVEVEVDEVEWGVKPTLIDTRGGYELKR